MTARLGQVGGVLALAAAALGASSCGGDKSVEDEKLPYSFSFPSDFNRGEQNNLQQEGGAFENATVIAKGDGAELVSVQTQQLRLAVTPRIAPQLKRQLEATARRDASVVSRKDVKVDGLDGVQFRVELKQGRTATSALWTYVAKGRTLFYVNCQWRQDRDAVLDACEEVTSSLDLK